MGLRRRRGSPVAACVLDIGHDGRILAAVAVDRQETLDLLQRDARALERALQTIDREVEAAKGRADEAKHGGGPDQRAADGLGRKPRDIYIPDLRLGSGIKVPTRSFR